MQRIVLVLLGLMLAAGSSIAGDWGDRIKVKGDLRYRHEMIDKEGSDTRHRQRVRARVAVDAKVNDITSAVVQFATGSDDPVSTNQTLGNNFSTKSLMLDLAYVKIKPTQVEGLTITGGKFKNPFFKPGKSELIWDSDLNPEGGAFQYSKSASEYTLTLTGAGLWIVERSSDKDSWIAAGQGVFKYNVDDEKTDIAVGGSIFNYVNTKGFEPFFDSSDPMGNSLDANDLYANDYRLIEIFIEINHNLNNLPVTLLGDFVTNTSADSLETAWLAGIRMGKTKKTGSWAARYNYREVKKDAVIGMFADSDFRGGGTDANGHEVGVGYQVMKNGTLSVSYFMNKIGLDSGETDFNRLQVDLQLKFK